MIRPQASEEPARGLASRGPALSQEAAKRSSASTLTERLHLIGQLLETVDKILGAEESDPGIDAIKHRIERVLDDYERVARVTGIGARQ